MAERIAVAAVAAGIGCSSSHGATGPGATDAGRVADAGAPLDTAPPSDAGPAPVCGPAADCRVEQVIGGLEHTCALLASGVVACWGSNRQLQLARGDLEGSNRPLRIAGLPEITRLTRGHLFMCAVTAGGGLWCWGDGTEVMIDQTGGPSEGWISGVSDIVQLGTGLGHMCALQATGRVWCWGFRNGDGQLGDGSRDVHLEPRLVDGLEGVVELAVGAHHACARTEAGRVWCWGSNRKGQIGDGTGGSGDLEMDALSPVPVLDGARRVTAGWNFTCALRGAGEVLCWGSNDGAALGTGSFARSAPSPQPVALPAGVPIADIKTAPLGGHTCALTRRGRVICWGVNGDGELGYGGTDFTRVPVEAAGIDDATAIGLGYSTTCAIRGGGGLWCWGLNSDGQLGDGTTDNRDLPVRVVGLR